MPQPPGPREPRQVLSADDVRRALVRIAHEVAERNHGTDDLAVVGLQRGGVWIAEQLAGALTEIAGGSPIPSGRSTSASTVTTSACARSCRAASPTSPSRSTARR